MTAALRFADTLVVDHGIGITVTEGSGTQATLPHSVAWADDASWAESDAIATGAVHHWGALTFADPTTGDYHMGPDSAAIDAGVGVDVNTDMDGDHGYRRRFRH